MRSILTLTGYVLAAGLFLIGIDEGASAQGQRPAPPRAAAAQPAPQQLVDLNLVLAVDASGSVDDERFELQKQGYAAALRSPKVLAAIRAGDQQAIAISMLQWTGPQLHVAVVPWMVIRDARSAAAAADAIAKAPRELFGGGTSLSGAIDYSVLMLTASPYRATRRVIDISGDGVNNSGRPAEEARDEAVKMGIRINGLPILTLEPELDQYYKQNVTGGPGSFVIAVHSYEAFADAILRKLVTEISMDTPHQKFAAGAQSEKWAPVFR